MAFRGLAHHDLSAVILFYDFLNAVFGDSYSDPMTFICPDTIQAIFDDVFIPVVVLDIFNS